MLKALDVAKYLLSLVKQDEGDTISNLKLQKILYYVQGYYLACFDKPLFNDKIEAWAYGPVIPSVYSEYKQYGRECLPLNDFDYDLSTLTKEEIKLIKNIFYTYNDYSASSLVEMTHKEEPWLSVIVDGILTQEEIKQDIMKSYFKTQI